jgi:hypothetical protein
MHSYVSCMLAFDHSEVSFVTNTVSLRSSGVDGNYPGSVDDDVGPPYRDLWKTANLHQLHVSVVLVKAPPWIVTTPSSTVLCSAFRIGLTIYGIKRPFVGNLLSRPTILSQHDLD